MSDDTQQSTEIESLKRAIYRKMVRLNVQYGERIFLYIRDDQKKKNFFYCSEEDSKNFLRMIERKMNLKKTQILNNSNLKDVIIRDFKNFASIPNPSCGCKDSGGHSSKICIESFKENPDNYFKTSQVTEKVQLSLYGCINCSCKNCFKKNVKKIANKDVEEVKTHENVVIDNIDSEKKDALFKSINQLIPDSELSEETLKKFDDIFNNRVIQPGQKNQKKQEVFKDLKEVEKMLIEKTPKGNKDLEMDNLEDESQSRTHEKKRRVTSANLNEDENLEKPNKYIKESSAKVPQRKSKKNLKNLRINIPKKQKRKLTSPQKNKNETEEKGDPVIKDETQKEFTKFITNLISMNNKEMTKLHKKKVQNYLINQEEENDGQQELNKKRGRSGQTEDIFDMELYGNKNQTVTPSSEMLTNTFLKNRLASLTNTPQNVLNLFNMTTNDLAENSGKNVARSESDLNNSHKKRRTNSAEIRDNNIGEYEQFAYSDNVNTAGNKLNLNLNPTTSPLIAPAQRYYNGPNNINNNHKK